MRSFFRSPLMYYLRLPFPLQILIGVAAGGSIVGLLYWFFPGRALWIVIIGILVVGALLGGLRAVLKRRQKKRAAPMEQGIIDQSGATPQGISEAGRRARIDDLRRTFEAGVQKFRAAGKDLYSLPWYVIVGEPGSGKTEAIRHCNVGFPPGLHDPFQGAGGTINMNWWFTNRAVVLDTAGRLMFEEVEAGATGEWQEFLGLLRTHRPSCPINGLLLVIPADTLITDTADAIKSKAERIAQQLDTIQRTLEVRFPVFVAITKCDLINGFREFFENVTDPALQHQIMGWSNPNPLDEPFNPEFVDQHLESVCARLRRRRLGLLIDPVNTEDENATRMQQVDALFAFPQSLTRIASRLKLYLGIVFAGSEWSGKPLFLRGMYFTSSMREGSALDEELAEALGVPVESLPDGRVWERDRSYFLRDLFLEKVFQEKGLVTRATSARKQHRRRKAVVLAAGFAAVLILGFLTWWGSRALAQSIGVHRDYWLAAADDGNWDRNNVTEGPDYWKPIVKQDYVGAEDWRYSDSTVKVAAEKVGIVQCHYKLLKLAEEEVRVPWIFWLAQIGSEGIDEQRREAQRVLFEAGVLRPLVDTVRVKMLRKDDPWPEAGEPALAQLIRLELPGAELPSLDPFFKLALRQRTKKGEDKKADETVDYYQDKYLRDREPIHAVLKWIYGDGVAGWPPKGLGAGTPGAHEAIREGVGRFCSYHSAEGQKASTALGQVAELTELLLQRYKDGEASLLRVDDEFAPRLGRPTSPEVEVIKEAMAAWETRLGALEQARAEVEAKLAGFPGGPIYSTFEQRSGEIVQRIEKAFATFRQESGVQPPKEGGAPVPTPEGAARAPSTAASAAPGTVALPTTAAAPGTATATAAGSEAEAEARERAEKLLAELHAKLSETLDRIRKIAKPAAVADNVRQADLEFLNEVDIEEALWDRLVQAELLQGKGERRKLRLYELRQVMYRLADGERRARDQVPEQGTLRDGIARVDDNIHLACNRVEELRNVSPKAYRMEDGATVSVFVCRRLAKRQRVYRMLVAQLGQAPKTEADVAAAAQARAEKLPRLRRPTIPLTQCQGGHFEPKYHPQAVLALLRECRAAGDVLENPKLEVLERDQLLDLWKRWQAACNSYVGGEYHRYWTQTVPADLETKGQDWPSLRQTLRRTQPLDVFIALGDVGKAMADALSPDIAGLLPAAGPEAFARSRDRVQAGQGRVKNDVYQQKCKYVLDNWRKLSEDSFEVRSSLVPLTREVILERYLPFTFTSSEEFADRYWAVLTREALRLIILGAAGSARTALGELRDNYSRFPLDVPREGEQPLTPEQVDAARKVVDPLVVRWQVGPGERRRDPAGTDGESAEVGRMLDELASLQITEAQWEWLRKLKAVLDGLPGERKALKCEVWVLKDQLRPAAGDRWVHIRSLQGDRETGKGAGWPGADTKLCEVWYPGDRLQWKLHLHPSDPRENRSIVLDGPWAVVRLLHPGQVADPLYARAQFVHKWQPQEAEERRETPDLKVRDIVITIEDDQRTPRKLRIRLRLEKELPKADDWPTRPAN